MGINERHIIGGPWIGGVNASEATIKVTIEPDVQHVSLVLEKDEKPSEGNTWRPPDNVWTDENRDYKNNIYRFNPKNLQPNTRYHYALVTDGEIEEKTRGQFKTFPSSSDKTGFKFALGSCSRDPNEDVFRALLSEKDLLFFFHLGDLHYGNLKSSSLKKRLKRYDEALEDTEMCRLFRNLPIAYTWDDHDFVDNDSGGAFEKSDGTIAISDSAKTAFKAYDLYVPHYDFGNGQGGIFQSFTVGRVLFLLTDLRFNQTPIDANKRRILGDLQEHWLSDKLDQGKNMDLIVITSSYPYIVNTPEGKTNWGDYADERARLANLIKSKDIRNLCMISGDAHMLAIDDGSHSGFASISGVSGKGGFPVFHAASLSSSNSTKGGPYSMGSEQNGGSLGGGIAGKNQYGLFEVTYQDELGHAVSTPQVIWKGRRVKDGITRDLISHRFNAKKTFANF